VSQAAYCAGDLGLVDNFTLPAANAVYGTLLWRNYGRFSLFRRRKESGDGDRRRNRAWWD